MITDTSPNNGMVNTYVTGRKNKKIVKLDANDVVIDIGSNDGTTLSF